MRVGIIGAGGIAQYAHLPGYQKLPGVEVVAVSDADQARASETATKFRVPQVFADYHDMLKLGLDAVSVCVPNYLHAEAAIAALEAGAHVLCEKPMAINTAQAEAMIATAKRTGKYLMMAYNNRFRAETQALKKLITAGQLGEIYYARAGWIRRRGIPGRGSWFTIKEKSGGGALIDIGVHALDLTWWLMGSPTPVMAMGATYAKFGPDPNRGAGGWGQKVPGGVFDVDDLACALILFANGASLFLEASWASHIERDQMFLNILGAQAGIQFNSAPLQARLFTEKDGVSQDTTLVIPEAAPGSAHFAEVAHFVRCIREGCQPEATGEDGLVIMKILDAIYASAASGTSVAIGG